MSNKNQDEEKIMARTKKISDGKVLQILENHYAPYMTAGELANEVDMSRQGMHERLTQLEERGQINKKKTGRSVGWWVAEKTKSSDFSTSPGRDLVQS